MGTGFFPCYAEEKLILSSYLWVEAEVEVVFSLFFQANIIYSLAADLAKFHWVAFTSVTAISI